MERSSYAEDPHRLESRVVQLQELEHALGLIPRIWVRTDAALCQLMSWCPSDTSGFEEMGREERRPLYVAIRQLCSRIAAVGPSLEPVLHIQLEELIDLLNPDEYCPNIYGEVMERWRQMWPATGIEKHLRRAERLVAAHALHIENVLAEPGASMGAAWSTADKAADADARTESPELASKIQYDIEMLLRLVKVAREDPDAYITSTSLLAMGDLPHPLKVTSLPRYWRQMRKELVKREPPVLKIADSAPGHRTPPAALCPGMVATLAALLEEKKEEKKREWDRQNRVSGVMRRDAEGRK